MAEAVEVDLVDTTAGYVLLASGEICIITNMFDEDGMELDEEDILEGDEAVSCVIKLADQRWATIWPRNVVERTFH